MLGLKIGVLYVVSQSRQFSCVELRVGMFSGKSSRIDFGSRPGIFLTLCNKVKAFFTIILWTVSTLCFSNARFVCPGLTPSLYL